MKCTWSLGHKRNIICKQKGCQKNEHGKSQSMTFIILSIQNGQTQNPKVATHNKKENSY